MAGIKCKIRKCSGTAIRCEVILGSELISTYLTTSVDIDCESGKYVIKTSSENGDAAMIRADYYSVELGLDVHNDEYPFTVSNPGTESTDTSSEDGCWPFQLYPVEEE